MLPDGDVLVTAGVSSAGLFSELYHPAAGQWPDASGGLSACSSVRECRFGSTATLLSTGNVLLAGGATGLYSNPGSTATAMLYDPATDAWTATGSMGTPRQYQMASPLADGQVLIAGETDFTSHRSTFLASAELHAP